MDVSKVPLGRHQVEKTSIRSVGRCQIVVQHRKSSALAARSAGLLGRVEQSSPNTAWRRAEGAGLDGEGADRAIIYVVAMRVVFGHRLRDQVPDFTDNRRCTILRLAIGIPSQAADG